MAPVQSVNKVPYLSLRSANSEKTEVLLMGVAEVLSKGQWAEIVLVVEDARISPEPITHLAQSTPTQAGTEI